MPLNSYATLGRSGLRVSPFCLGAMTFGESFTGPIGQVASSRTVRMRELAPLPFPTSGSPQEKGHRH